MTKEPSYPEVCGRIANSIRSEVVKSWYLWYRKKWTQDFSKPSLRGSGLNVVRIIRQLTLELDLADPTCCPPSCPCHDLKSCTHPILHGTPSSLEIYKFNPGRLVLIKSKKLLLEEEDKQTPFPSSNNLDYWMMSCMQKQTLIRLFTAKFLFLMSDYFSSSSNLLNYILS